MFAYLVLQFLQGMIEKQDFWINSRIKEETSHVIE